MRKNANKSRAFRTARRITRWSLASLVVLAAAYLAFVLLGRLACRAAIARLERTTNTTIHAASVDFRPTGSVLITALNVRNPAIPADRSLIMQASTVRAALDLRSLLLLKPRLKRIDVNDFTFNLAYDVDTGRWNLPKIHLQPPSGRKGKTPLLKLDHGTLRYVKSAAGRVKTNASLPISATFGLNAASPEAYGFEITAAPAGLSPSRLTGAWKPGRLALAATIAPADIGEITMPWAIDALNAEITYEPNNNYSLTLAVKDLYTGSSPKLERAVPAAPFLEKYAPFAALQRFFLRYGPRGLVDINLTASGNLANLPDSTISGHVLCKDIAICHDKFRYPIEHLMGRIDFTQNKALFTDLHGQHGRVSLFFRGSSGDFGPDWKYDVTITSDNMALDKDLYNALNAEQKKRWDAIRPSGLAAVDYRIVRRSKTDRHNSLTVELVDANALYQGFPYPLNNLTGKISFDPGRTLFENILAKSGRSRIILNGAVETVAEHAKYDFSIDVNNIPLDTTLSAALPRKQRDLYDRLRLAGLADGHIDVSHTAQTSHSPPFNADLFFKQASIESDRLGLPISDVSARAVFTPDSIHIKSLAGRCAGANLSLKGRMRPDEKGLDSGYDLSLRLDGASLNDDLFAILPENLAAIVSRFKPAGKVNLAADVKKAAPQDQPDYNLTVECLGDTLTLAPLPHPLTDVTGTVLITPGAITLKNLSASGGRNLWIEAGPSAIKLDGRIETARDKLAGAVLRLSARDIFFDERLVDVLPERLRDFYKNLEPLGRIDLNLDSVIIRPGDDGQSSLGLRGAVEFRNCGLKLADAYAEWDAVIDTNAFYHTAAGLRNCRAELNAERLSIQGRNLTNLTAHIDYDNNRRLWTTENLAADCYHGRLAGRFLLKQPPDAPMGFLFQTGFKGIDLAEFLADARLDPGDKPDDTTGTLSGTLSLAATLGDIASRIGKCRFVITDMRVGKLSPLAKVLQVLQLNEPTDFAFDQMLVDSYIRRRNLLVRKLDLAGKSLAFHGSGLVDLDKRDVDLTLTARGRRLATAGPSVLESLTEGLGQAVVRLEVTGDLDDPQVKTIAFPLISGSLETLGAKQPPENPE
ncbi:MAG: AsmA-like C-terminal domain-containing protein [Phycisphaerales bacterium]|nr:MAG: AsmA-like C-terminal domain-containing protein [Phycisphaerales bacterium]